MALLDFIPKPTPQLKIMADQYEKTLPPQQFQGLIEDIRKIYSKYAAILAAYSPGAERAKAAHRLIHLAMEQAQNIEPTCTKGCGACCHLEVEVTQDEGELLAQVVLDGHSINRERLELQALRERQSPA